MRVHAMLSAVVTKSPTPTGGDDRGSNCEQRRVLPLALGLSLVSVTSGWNPHGHGGAASVPVGLQASPSSCPLDRKWLCVTIRRVSLHKRLLRSQQLNWVNCHSGRGWSQSYSSQGPCQLAKQPASEGHGHIGRYRRLHKKICEGGKHALSTTAVFRWLPT